MAEKMTQKEAYEYMRNAPHMKKVREGDYKPGAWFYAEPGDGTELWHSWGARATPGKRGLTFFDTNRVDPRRSRLKRRPNGLSFEARAWMAASH